jgi:integrase/recombinase XerD
MSRSTALTCQQAHAPALQNAIVLWADATTDAGTDRRPDLLRDKQHAVIAFFEFTGKHPAEVTPLDVKTWQAELEAQGLSPATVYARISRVSSFYHWAMKDLALAEMIHSNPVKLARPKAPKAYQSERTQALDDDQVRSLVRVVKTKADAGDVVGKRDLALLLFYLETGMRRREVIRLKWSDLKINDIILLTGRIKGGDYVAREVRDKSVRDALLDYLTASGRLVEMSGDSPVWTRHDRAGKPGGPLTSHAFAKNLKRYARQAGIGDIHLHQTRHTFARMVSEDTGSIIATQDALGHKNVATTRVYVNRIAIKRDKHSAQIAARLGLN